MMQKMACVFYAFCSFQLVSAGRVEKNGVAGGLLHDAQVNDQPLKDFIKETSLNCTHCEQVHGLLIGNLVEGLIEAGKVSEIMKDGSKLTVKLKTKVYGQVASRSSVPIMWVVDEILTADVKSSGEDISVDITGLHTDVPAQAYEFYKEIITKNGLLEDAKKCGELTSSAGTSSLEKEHEATTAWFAAHYKNNLKDLGTSKKVGKVLKSIVDNLAWVVKKSITYANWGNIVYSMISATPKTITGMKFSIGKGAVVATTRPNKESSNNMLADEYCLLQKAQILGAKAITNAPSMLSSTLASQSKSGWGFGMMFGHGDPEVATAIKRYGKANPAYLVNLFSLCQKGSAEEDPPCSGSDKGRLHWTDNVPEEYL